MGNRFSNTGGGGNRFSRGQTGLLDAISYPTELGQPLPSMEQPDGRTDWQGNNFMGLIDWLVGFSRVGTQTVAGFNEAYETGEWDFDYNWWEYTDERDPHQALSSGAQIATNAAQGAFMGAALGSVIPGAVTVAGGVVGGVAGAGIGLAELLGLDSIPDTPEQATEALREQANRIQAQTDNPLVAKAAEALPLLAGIWNEHTLAEMAFDPLQAVADFGIGSRIAGGINRATSPLIKRAIDLPLIAPLAQYAEKQILGWPMRRMRRFAEESAQELGVQLSHYDEVTRQAANALRETVGDDAYLQAVDTMSDIIERTPKTFQIAEDVAEEAMQNILRGEELGGVLPTFLDPTTVDESIIGHIVQLNRGGYRTTLSHSGIIAEHAGMAGRFEPGYMGFDMSGLLPNQTKRLEAAAKNAGLSFERQGTRVGLVQMPSGLSDDAIRARWDRFTEALAPREAVDLPPFARVSAEAIEGGTDRYAWLLEQMQTRFPEFPPVAHEFAARNMNRSITQSAMVKAYENIKGIPTSALDDIQYLYHLITPGARAVQRQAIGELSGDALEEWYRSQRSLRNVLGREATEPLRSRSIRKRLEEINRYSADGRAGYVRGKPELHLLESGAEIPENFIPIKGDIFHTDSFIIDRARAARSVRAVTATDFLRDAGETFGSQVAKPGYRTLKGILEGTEWDRSFGRLSPEIREMATNTYFKDKETAKAVLSHFQMFRAIERKPGPILRYIARFKRMWGAVTLTPFTSTSNRNAIGGMIINHQRYGAGAALHNIDALVKLWRGEGREISELASRGMYKHNWLEEIYRAGESQLDITPYSPTPLKSLFRSIVNPKKWFPWKTADEGTFLQRLRRIDANDEFIGNEVYQFIDNHQRTVAALAERSLGKSWDDAVKESFRWHIDYADVPPWYNTIRPMLAFPTWAIKMIPIQLELLYRNPAHVSKFGRIGIHAQEATGLTPAEIPEIIREGGGFGIPTIEPDRPMWFRPENFDPVAIFSDISDPFRFGYDMFNPLITELPEQLVAARRVRSGFGGPSEATPVAPFTRGAENVGWDPFFERPIVRGYTEFNEALPLAGGKKMPAWAQRADHAMRGFLRYYSEFSSAFKTIQREDETGANITEVVARRGFGVPVFWQEMDQAIYFNLREVNQNIGAEEARTTQRPEELKDLYLQKLALLAHGTFAQQDPFTGELRHWADYGTEEDDFTIAGRRTMWQAAIETCWLLLTGSRSPVGEWELQEPIQLDQTEEDYIEGLLNRLLDTYTIEVGNASARGEAQYGRSMQYVEERRGY